MGTSMGVCWVNRALGQPGGVNCSPSARFAADPLLIVGGSFGAINGGEKSFLWSAIISIPIRTLR